MIYLPAIIHCRTRRGRVCCILFEPPSASQCETVELRFQTAKRHYYTVIQYYLNVTKEKKKKTFK